MSEDRQYLLDVTRLIWRRWSGRLPTGIDRVCLAYLERYGAQSQAVIQRGGFRRILSPAASDRLFAILLDGKPQLRFRLSLALASGMIGSSSTDRTRRLYLNLGHTGLDQPGLTRWIRAAGVRPVFFVHDLIPISHPQFCRPVEEARHRERMRAVLTTATAVIGNSQATLDAFAHFAREEGLPEPPMLAAWLGCDAATWPAAQERAEDGPATFLVVGTIEARKNHAMLLDIWERLAARLGAATPKLVVIGQRGWECDDVLERLVRLDPAGPVVDVGQCDDSGLAAHFNSARALLFPSKVEGFGLPLVEALAAGTPVIASDLPVFREIGQGVPEFVDPSDSRAWESVILDYATADSAAFRAQRGRLSGFRPFTWDDHFRAVDGFLATLDGAE